MGVLEGLRLALSQIWSHKLKSFFSLLGIVVGITFLIAVITIVEGMNRYVQEDVGGSIFGVNTFTVVRATRVQTGTRTEEERRRQARNPRLDLHDVAVVRGAVPDEALMAYADDRVLPQARRGQHTRRNVRIVGGSEGYMELQGWEVTDGRGLTPLDHRRSLPVAVIGADIAERLFPQGSPLGGTVRAGAHRYEVIGVLERQGGLFGNIRDASLLVPFTVYRRRVADNPDRVDAIHVKTATTEAMDDVMASVEGALRADRGLRPGQENDFHLETSGDLLSAWNRINRILLTALPGLVSIALVVGGIVIMNIMLVSVSQRTREIGIRKAIGASQRDILTQFLFEAGVLSGLGAALGVGLGVGLAALVEAVSPLPASTPLWAVG
ncbi:MAG TPA: ABC transporter permease, partial [Longimicrobiales bacterium]|nr:ABC transporter permease [Longimicrobiales bacterium]